MKKVICFGEVLWDCLPAGEHPGGAPLNVAYHLARLGCRPVMLSAVGKDEHGTRMLKWLKDAGINTERMFVHDDLPTGKVNVAIDARGNASYDIARPAAWDRVPVDDDTLHATTASDALVCGTLACRTPENLESLKFLVALWEPLKVLDVNLRPPFDRPEIALELGRRCDVIKVNDEEVFTLTGIRDEENTRLHDAIHRLSEMTGCGSICVTRGGAGAIFLHHGRWYSADAPSVEVRDTVGAGDAFTAALVAFLLAKRPEHEFSHGLAACCALGAFVAGCDGAQPAYDPRDILKDASWIG